jgi:hypothetical protein
VTASAARKAQTPKAMSSRTFPIFCWPFLPLFKGLLLLLAASPLPDESIFFMMKREAAAAATVAAGEKGTALFNASE